MPKANAYPSFYASYLGAEQARIVLQLAIGAGYSLDELRDVFEGPLTTAIHATHASQVFFYSN